MTMEVGPAYVRLQDMKVEVMIGCSNLVDMDTFTKSDPMCVLFVKRMGQWIEHDRTEAIKNTLDPKFVKSFILDYDPRRFQHLRFSVYDIDYRDSDLDKQDFVGSVDVTFLDLVDVDDVMLTLNKTLRVPEHSRPRGTISITTELVNEARNKVSVHMVGHNLQKKGFLNMGKPSIFLEISRELEQDVYHPVYRTDPYPESTCPRWRPFHIDCQKLCNNDMERKLKLSCWYYSKSEGKYHMIGETEGILSDFQKSESTKSHYTTVTLLSRKKGPKEKQTARGDLRIISFRVEMKYTLRDYLLGGLHIKLAVAIDFTASNGELDEEHCLHSLENSTDNHYTHAIESLGGMITDLNVDKKIVGYGFGAKWKKKEYPSHCFPLTGDKNNHHLNDIQHLISTYKEILPSLKFSGPTKLSPIIEKAKALAERQNMSKMKHVYTVLLVITDGVINDLNKTLKRIVESSHQPLSILFVGVGPADFTIMEQFNTDQEPLRYEGSGKTADRPNTYFLPYRREEIENYGDAVLKSNTMEVLSRQILQYMRTRQLEPLQPTRRADTLLTFDTIDGTQLDTLQNTANIRVKSAKPTAPSCPTCGAAIDLHPTSADMTAQLKTTLMNTSLVNGSTL